MSNLAKHLVLSKSNLLMDEVCKLVPSTKKSLILKLFEEFSEEVSNINFQKLYHVRKLDGSTELFSSIDEAAKVLEITTHSLRCYLSQGKGTATVKGQTVSTEEFLEPGPKVEVPDKKFFWFRHNQTGEVVKSDDINLIAKLARISSRTLYVYLSVGKGETETKTGLVSRAPLEPIDPSELWELNYYKKHGIWPNPTDNPHLDKRRLNFKSFKK